MLDEERNVTLLKYSTEQAILFIYTIQRNCSFIDWVLKWLLSQLYDFFLPVVTASLTFKQKLQLMKVCVNSFSFCNYCHTMTVQHHICGIFTYISNLRNTHWLHWLFLSRFKFFILFSYCCIFYTEVLFT